MSLRDTACYTLTLRPSTSDPKVVELVSVEGAREEHRFARVREQKEGEGYSAAIYDTLSGAKLASVGYVTDRQKNRRLQLHNPDENVVFDNTSKLGFEWTFVFEGNKYRWNKEVYGKNYICSLDRKPDPEVQICLARGGDSKSPGQIQILHYNIDRFPDDIKDLRGLETLLVASLMCLIDAVEERSNPTSISRPALPSKVSSNEHAPLAPVVAGPSSLPPPKVITQDDFEDVSDPNEILVGQTTDVGEHTAKAIGLLEDPNMLFIVIRTKTAAASQRALEVSLGVTRFRHREGLGDLHQYVIEEDPVRAAKPPPISAQKGPRVINLDDRPAPLPAAKPKWTGPPNIAIYLSTIELPDLKPKPKGGRPPAQAQPQMQSKPVAQSRPQAETQPQAQVPYQTRPSPSHAPSRPPVLSKPSPRPSPRPPPPQPQLQSQPQSLPPRSDRPGGSASSGHMRPPPPQPPTAADGHEPRKTSFGRLLNNLVRQ